MKSACAVLFFFAVAMSAQAGQVYKWTDEKGRVHYGDKPVANAKKVEPKPGTQPPASEPGADRRARECVAQREKLETYRSASKVVEQDSLGRDREYSEEERQQLITRTEQRIAELCQPRRVTDEDAPPAENLQPEAREEPLPEEERPR